MDQKMFTSLVDFLQHKSKELLTSKNTEYASDREVLSAFSRASAMLGQTRQEALMGMLSKHIVSLVEFVEKDSAGQPVPVGKLLERIVDSVNYHFLLFALFVDDFMTDDNFIKLKELKDLGFSWTSSDAVDPH